MSQLWAIVSSDGTFVLRFTDSADITPSDAGHEDESKGNAIWPLEREPDQQHGEKVDFNTGKITFDLEYMQPGRDSALNILISQIKEEAGRRILEQYPMWKQINDMDLPDDDVGKKERKAIRDSIRTWSNQLEERARASKDAEAMKLIQAELLAK